MEIANLKNAEEVLINSTNNKDLNDIIYDEISKWTLNKNCVYDDINKKTKELLDKLELTNETHYLALQWILFDYIGLDLFNNYIQLQFTVEDSTFFHKCQQLNQQNISVEQLRGNENYSIQLTAAIVELSVLDTYHIPMEKLNCLLTTFDLIYAELKSALILIISKYSDKENEIPIINNNDLIPVLMFVVIKSKLTHIYSNLEYIKKFHEDVLARNHNICNIFKIYEMAVDNINFLKISSLPPSNNKKLAASLDLCEYIQLTSPTEDEDDEKSDKCWTVLDEEKRRILDLIITSTDKKM